MRDYTRRQIFEMSPLCFLYIVAGLPRLLRAAQNADGRQRFRRETKSLSWSYFVDRVARIAENQYSAPWDQEAYVKEVANTASRLNWNSHLFEGAPRAYSNIHFGMPEFTNLYSNQSFQVNLISFEKGDVIPAHNHPNMTGVICCGTGELAVTNCAISDNQRHATLVETGRGILTPGKVSTLTATRANIHQVEAVSFCQIIDIFTPPYDEERQKHTRWYRTNSPGSVLSRGR